MQDVNNVGIDKLNKSDELSFCFRCGSSLWCNFCNSCKTLYNPKVDKEGFLCLTSDLICTSEVDDLGYNVYVRDDEVGYDE